MYSVLDLKKDAKLNEGLVKKRVSDLQEYIKMLDTQLVEWKRSVEAAREKYYELNYFTTCQLLELRRELGHLLHPTTVVSSVKPSVLMLLRSVSPKVSNSVVLESLQAIPVAQEPTITDEDLTTKHTNAKSSIECKMTVTSTSTSQKPGSLIPISSPYKLELFSEEKQEDFRYLTENLGYSKSHVLKAFEECGQDANLYDIEEWCENNVECPPTSESEDEFFDCEDFNTTKSGKLLIYGIGIIKANSMSLHTKVVVLSRETI